MSRPAMNRGRFVLPAPGASRRAREHALGRARVAIAALATLIALGAGGCGRGGTRQAAIPRDAQKAPMIGETALTDTTAEFPRLRFADGQISLNDRCMVRQVKLNPRLPAIYVNGRPVGFC